MLPPDDDDAKKWVPNDNRLRREDFIGMAQAVEGDFRRLVDALTRATEMAGGSDRELVERISATKALAERGWRLSKLLSKTTRGKRD